MLTAGLGDGRVNVYDLRSSQMVKAAVVAKAAINALEVASNNLLVTGSADKLLKCFDLRAGEGKNLQRVRQIRAPASILCGTVAGNSLAFAGCGDGNVYGFNLMCGSQPLFGCGAEQMNGTVNVMRVDPDRKFLVAGGDSGQALKLQFNPEI